MKPLIVSALIVVSTLSPIIPCHGEEPSDTIILNIRGMACGQCAKSVENGLKKLDGVVDVKVDISKAEAVIMAVKDRTSREELAKAVMNMGFIAGR